jgi:hypothetical protein
MFEIRLVVTYKIKDGIRIHTLRVDGDTGLLSKPNYIYLEYALVYKMLRRVGE